MDVESLKTLVERASEAVANAEVGDNVTVKVAIDLLQQLKVRNILGSRAQKCGNYKA